MSGFEKGGTLAQPAFDTEEHVSAHPIASNWLCTNRHSWRVPRPVASAAQWLSEAMNWLVAGRLGGQTWIRYRIELSDGTTTALSAPAPEVRLTPIDEAIMARLRSHPSRERDQLQSAFKLWRHGLQHAFIWQEDDEPLCFMWLFLPKHNSLLRSLPSWAGMYPPLPAGWGHFENVFTFGRGLRRRGGAATDFAHAVIQDAKARGLTGLVTHMHEDNLMARRWAERTGCRPFGTITRYHLDVPLLRSFPWFIHRVCEVQEQPRVAPRQPRAAKPKASKGTSEQRKDFRNE